MPKVDGKPVRRSMTSDEMFEWRERQLLEDHRLEKVRRLEKGKNPVRRLDKGKNPVRGLDKGKNPVRHQAEAPSSEQSPSTALASLSINAPAAHSPGDHPSHLPGNFRSGRPVRRPRASAATPFSEHAASTSTLGPSTTSPPFQFPKRQFTFSVEMPPPPRQLQSSRSRSSHASDKSKKAALTAPLLLASRSRSSIASDDSNKAGLSAPRLQASHSASSNASDDASNARIAALEEEVVALKKELETLRAQASTATTNVRTALARYQN
jgi:ribosomal protein L29